MNRFISSSDAKITLAQWISADKRIRAWVLILLFLIAWDVISDKFLSFHLCFLFSATVMTRSTYASGLKTSIKWLWDICKMIKNYVSAI